MKKTFLIVAALFVFGATYAQVSIGPKAGLNIATLTGTPQLAGDEKRILLGFNAGIAANIGISEIFSVQPELYFSQQGFKIDREILNVPGTITQTFNYINLPVLAKATFGEGNMRGYVNLGPYVGYMVGGKETIETEGGEAVKTPIDFDQKTELNRLDFGVVAGGGALFKAGKGDIMLDLRYSLGLTTVSDEVIFEAGRDTNSVPSVSVGYLIPLGER